VHDGAGILTSVDVGVQVTDQPIAGSVAVVAQAPSAPAPAPVVGLAVDSSVAPPTHISAGAADPTGPDTGAAAGGLLAMLAGLAAVVRIRKRQISAR
jgi:hypothetical protein